MSSEPGQDLEGNALDVLFPETQKQDGDGVGMDSGSDVDELVDDKDVEVPEHAIETTLGPVDDSKQNKFPATTRTEVINNINFKTPLALGHSQSASASSSISSIMGRKTSNKRTRIDSSLGSVSDHSNQLINIAWTSYKFKTASLRIKCQKMELKSEHDREGQKFAAEERALIIQECMQEKEFEHKEQMMKYEIELAQLKATSNSVTSMSSGSSNNYLTGPVSFEHEQGSGKQSFPTFGMDFDLSYSSNL